MLRVVHVTLRVHKRRWCRVSGMGLMLGAGICRV